MFRSSLIAFLLRNGRHARDAAETAVFRYVLGIVAVGLVFAWSRGLFEVLDRLPAAPLIGLGGFAVAAVAFGVIERDR